MQDERPPDRRQLDDVLDALLPFAHQLLDRHGEFFPFGAAMGRDGKVSMVADQCVAVGLCYDVRVRKSPDAPPTDAICVSLEHRDGMSVDVVEPYAKRANKMEYGSLSARQGRKIVFGV